MPLNWHSIESPELYLVRHSPAQARIRASFARAAMSNPLRSLRRLPWTPLLLNAILTVFWIFVIEFLLWLGLMYVPLVRDVIGILYAPPLNVLMELAVAIGVGALAVYLLEIVHSQVLINAGTLWALLLCLMLVMIIKALLPIPALLVRPGTTLLVGMMVGIFLKGKPYWR